MKNTSELKPVQLKLKTIEEKFTKEIANVVEKLQMNLDFKHLVVGEQSLRINAERDKIAQKYTKQVQELINSLETELEQTKKEENKVKFPLFTSPAYKQLGATEIQSAIIFLTRSRTSNEILSAIEEAIELQRFDFLSQMINQILLLETKNDKTLGLKNDVLRKVSKIYNDLGLTDLEKREKEIKKDLLTADLYLKRIENRFVGGEATLESWEKVYNSVEVKNYK